MWKEHQALDGDTKEAMAKHIHASATHGKLSSALKLCASLPDIAVTHDEFDADDWLLNCGNGTIDLRTGELRKHNPADCITKFAGASYHPDATCPKWMAFLERIFNGDQEVMDYVQEIAGMCLTGDVSEQIMPVFFGHGSNGKSTLLDTLMMVMGDYAGNAAPDLLVARTNEAHPTEVADLWGLRLAVASEPDEGVKLRIGLVKRMTGDAMLKARYMYGNFFDFRRTHKMIYVANSKPRVSESSDGIWRRLRLVEFAAKIEDHEKDKQLMSKLAGEKMGILAWAVQGCLRWQRNAGLTEPADVVEATRAYREDEDALGDFFSTRLVLDPQGWVLLKDVRRAYGEYCKAEDVQYPMSERALFAKIEERPGVTKAKKSLGRGFTGLRFSV
jgi:putative DNA primase/helicase